MKKTPSSASLLLAWYRKYGRDLPWRHTRDPYPILVSEMMLQQTQVERGLLFYNRWIKCFPNWKTLSKATNAQVVRAWSGLGYNRRALALRDIAKHVNKNGLPQTEEEWKQLKGIGPYTAAAISAFAQKKRTMPIDTNIRRVLGRLLLEIPYPQLSDDKILEHKIDSFLPTRGHYFDVPQALFDLATLICTKTPSCNKCPLRSSCKVSTAFLSGKIEIPKATIKKPKEKTHRNKPYPDRIYRGRILKLVKEHPKGLSFKNLGLLIDPLFNLVLDQDWLSGMIERLQQERFLKRTKTKIFLSD
ncbi:MAG: HhH-GPD family protein [Candidatus Uhrbacteria bacterium GW2011_GWE2_40_58]|nr:MAG: HhH-GPD family protein [Candidatus Uhrbacteria bacterium GW2011_GWF2_40_263]KKR66841.1 MAG: HhH-GPD family protein [Candidatus Uhrbacteria bacterium GW2011_GWE2_40_58]OGL93397.1 MAG: hypothetical protein A2239_01795 [Candidatus Uhrbacteria bacterium RIFOXYA2_FULL_40_9]OGL97340.1 MAG: hypothetical protein A2332_01290 [Candidatus Uhrbacteria bacterium RIFOXYB2_FULL_41_18]HCB56148.1 A/G-specific adenine glycosylase [Candidatus Uhrbacteria bacterium]